MLVVISFKLFFVTLRVFPGSVLDQSLAVVIDRLRGLCDNADIPPETFHDHEVVYILKDFNGMGEYSTSTV